MQSVFVVVIGVLIICGMGYVLYHLLDAAWKQARAYPKAAIGLVTAVVLTVWWLNREDYTPPPSPPTPQAYRVYLRPPEQEQVFEYEKTIDFNGHNLDESLWGERGTIRIQRR